MTAKIQVKSRKSTEKVKQIRENGFVPGVVYGPEFEPKSIVVEKRVLEKIYKQAGDSSLIDLTIDSAAPIKVLFQELQHEPVRGFITHVDFKQINMKKVLHASVHLEFIGESLAVKELAGTLVKNLTKIEVKCLPQDLVGSISVDLGALKTFDDKIFVKDLKLPAGIQVENDLNDMVVTAVPVKEEVEEKGPASVADIEVVGKKKEEGEEAAEDAEAKPGEKAQAKSGDKEKEKK